MTTPQATTSSLDPVAVLKGFASLRHGVPPGTGGNDHPRLDLHCRQHFPDYFGDDETDPIRPDPKFQATI